MLGATKSSFFKRAPVPDDRCVDFGAAHWTWIENENKGFPVSAQATSEATVLRKEGAKKRKTWTIEEMIEYNDSEDFRQSMYNSILYAIEKARDRALYCGTSQPPLPDTLDYGLVA